MRAAAKTAAFFLSSDPNSNSNAYANQLRGQNYKGTLVCWKLCRLLTAAIHYRGRKQAAPEPGIQRRHAKKFIAENDGLHFPQWI